MKTFWILLAMLLFAGSAAGQMYKWVDKDGKVRYGDTPPPGAKTATVRAPSSGSQTGAPPAASKDFKDDKAAAKGPMTPAEKEQDFRKRQADSRKEAEKADAERRDKTARNEGCERTREYLRTLESGQRIARTNPSGERYYLDDNQVAQEVAKAQQSVQQACK